MIATGRGDETLRDFLAARARRNSDGRLAVHVAAGLVVATAAAVWGGAFSLLLCGLALMNVGYGLWGIFDRELGERSSRGSGSHMPLRLARALAGGLGIVAAVASLFAFMALALGTWIS